MVEYDTLILAIIELLHLIRMLLVYLSALGELIGRAARRLSLDSSFPIPRITSDHSKTAAMPR